MEITVDDNITLKLVNPAFAPRYVELVTQNNAYLAKWLGWVNKCNNLEFFQKFIAKSLTDFNAGKSMTCAIEYQGDIVGNISFSQIDHSLKKVEIGYWLAEQYQGNGIITRACNRLIDYAFTELKVEKVQIAAAEHNLPSRQVCERLGMKLEGIISHREKVGERILSHAMYALYNPALPKP